MGILKRAKSKYFEFINEDNFGKIFSGSILVFAAKVIATILGLVTSILVARYYGSAMIGILALLNSYFAIITILTLFGTNTSILRLIPEYQAKYSRSAAWLVYKKSRLLVILLSIILGGILFFSSNWIAGFVFKRPDLDFVFEIASIILVFKTLQSFSLQGIRAVQKINEFAFIQLLMPIVYLISLVIMTFLYYNKFNPVYLQFLLTILISIISLIIINKSFPKNERTNKESNVISIQQIIKVSFPMFLTSSSIIIMGQIATIMIGIYLSKEEVGYYTIALKIAMLTTFVLQAINTVIAPKFAELYNQNNIIELFSIARKSTKLIFWTILPLLLIFVFFGKWLIVSFYGQEFIESYILLIILSIGLLVNSVAGPVGYFLNMCGEESLVRNTMILSVIISLTLNIIFIPSIGLIGAAIATTIVQVFWNVALTILVYRKYNQHFFYFPFIQIKNAIT